MKNVLIFFAFIISSVCVVAQPTIASGDFLKFKTADGNTVYDRTVSDLSAAIGGGTGSLTGILKGNGSGGFTEVTTSSTVGQVLRVTGANTYAFGALDLADGDAVTGTLGIANGGTGLTAMGSDVTLLGSNGTANIYYTLARTNTSAAIGWSRSSTTLNFNLPDADASFPGIVSTGTQTMAGAKTFSGAVTVQGLLSGSAGVDGTATSSVEAVSVHGVEAADYVVISANTTLDHTHNKVYVTTLTADRTISLPACNSTRDGWQYHIEKLGSDTFGAIIDPNAAETFFDGASTKTLYSRGTAATCTCRSSDNTWFFETN